MVRAVSYSPEDATTPHPADHLVKSLQAERDTALASLAERDAEVERLKKLVYVPGQWRCAKCKFVCQKMTLNANTLAVGVQADTKTEVCPNGCGPLWPATERDAGNELADRIIEALDREKTLLARLEVAEKNQRSPGTAEVCEHCGYVYENFGDGSDGAKKRCFGFEAPQERDAKCPIRKGAATAKGE